MTLLAIYIQFADNYITLTVCNNNCVVVIRSRTCMYEWSISNRQSGLLAIYLQLEDT